MNELTRRDLFIAGAGLAAAAGLARAGLRPEPAPARRRVLRFAHLTDSHVQPERGANEGLKACLEHVQSHRDRPELIITGGDNIMDAFDQDFDRTRLQSELWNRIMRDECSTPLRNTIGNHDIWGWNKAKSRTTGEEQKWGKHWPVEFLSLPGRYYSFDQAGWHFIILDSVTRNGNGYIGRLDDEQFEWLSGDLAANRLPTVVVSHIPILSATSLAVQSKEPERNHEISRSLMHVDHARIRALFARHGTVKACLSGHTHIVERLDSGGVSYFCNGAVSGAWWEGPHHDCHNGYALIDLFDDGSIERRYITYGWEARP